MLSPSSVDGGGTRFNQKASTYLPKSKASHPSRQTTPTLETFPDTGGGACKTVHLPYLHKQVSGYPVMGAKSDIRSTNPTVSTEHRGWVIFQSYFVFTNSRFQFYVQRFRMAHPDRLTVVFSRYQSVQENCLLPFPFISFWVNQLTFKAVILNLLHFGSH
jgi:hypothetical protein